MNLRVAINAFMLFTALSLIAYGFSAYVNAFFGWQSSLFNEAWKLIALSTGAAIIAGFAYPHARGIRQGDQLMAFAKREQQFGALIEPLFVTALEPGRRGRKIRVRLSNGALAEGIVLSYAGTFSPPTIQLTEKELS